MLRVVMKHLIATNRSSWPNLDLSNGGTTSAALTEQLNQRAEFRVTPLHQRTLKAVVDRLRGTAAISELRTAVIWLKGASSYSPEYFVEVLPTSPWIHQPFEDYDNLRPEGLAKKFAV